MTALSELEDAIEIARDNLAREIGQAVNGPGIFESLAPSPDGFDPLAFALENFNRRIERALRDFKREAAP
jgi:hypothetical protein